MDTVRHGGTTDQGLNVAQVAHGSPMGEWMARSVRSSLK